MDSVFKRLPLELRNRPQWAIAGEEGAPYVIKENKLVRVSPHDTHLLHSFEEVEQYSLKHSLLVGFILTKDDELACVDLDIKDANNEPDETKWTSNLQLQSYQHIIHSLGGYTEHSRSGTGFHCWVKANIGAGVRRGGVEVYTQERFIICTGDVYLNYPVIEANQFFYDLVEEMRKHSKSNSSKFDLDSYDKEQELTDEQVLEIAQNASNGEKFKDLFDGNWQKYSDEYPSQSEADLALMAMFAFYSRNNEQCRRLFRLSVLGKREKATKNNRHLDLMLKMRRSKQKEIEDASNQMQADANVALSNLRKQAEAVLEPKVEQNVLPPEENYAKVDDVTTSIANLTAQCALVLHETEMTDGVKSTAHKAIQNINSLAPAQLAAKCEEATRLTGELAEIPSGGMDWPPGQVGVVARYIYSISPRPVKEISIAAALAFFAGVLGKAYNVSRSGLNLYIILIARSAVGKEAMNTGISRIVKALHEQQCDASRYIDFNEYVSGPALRKVLPEKPCFLNISGEFGKKLAQMADGKEGPLYTLKRLMTDLYQKSHKDGMVGGSAYSNKDNNTDVVEGVSYSLLGESTPQTFYECLTPTMMEDGFLSRFNIIVYKGERPKPNRLMDREVPPELVTYLISLFSSCARNNALNRVTDVELSEFSSNSLQLFETRCDDEIYGIEDEGIRQMWNRAHLKALRIAAVLAVADNDKMPVIQKQHSDWAIDCVLRDIANMKEEMERGNVGTGDDARIAKLVYTLKNFVERKPSKGYNVSEQMWSNYIIPRQFIMMRLQKTPVFARHRMGATFAINATLKEAISQGIISEVLKAEALITYGSSATCYKINNIPTFN